MGSLNNSFDRRMTMKDRSWAMYILVSYNHMPSTQGVLGVLSNGSFRIVVTCIEIKER